VRVVFDRVRLELLCVVRLVVVVVCLAEVQRRHALSTFGIHITGSKQMRRRGKTVPRGMYELHDLRLQRRCYEWGGNRARVSHCLAGVLLVDDLTIMESLLQQQSLSVVMYSRFLYLP